MLPEKANLKLVLCPVCSGTGWELVEGKGVRPCECQRSGRSDVLIAQSRIPARFMQCTFDSFEPLCPEVGRALMYTRKFVEEYPDRKSTRLNSSHQIISYAVFCLKK